MKKFMLLCFVILLCLTLVSCKSKDYDEANILLNQGKYSDALPLFESLGEYKDSLDKVKECKYHLARILLCLEMDLNDEFALPPVIDVYDSNASDTDIAKAKVLLESIGDYEESNSMLEKLDDIQEYDKAVSLFEKGNFDEALPIFEKFIDIETFHTQRYISAIEILSKVKGRWTGELEGDIDYRDYFSEQLSNGSISCEIGPPYSIDSSWFSDCDWCANARININAGYYVIKCGWSGNNLSYKTFSRAMEEGFHHTTNSEEDQLGQRIFILNENAYDLLFPSRMGIYSRIYISFNPSFTQMTIMEVPYDINMSMAYQSEANSVNLTKEK